MFSCGMSCTSCEGIAASPLQGRLDIDAQCRGFLELAKEATGHLVATIFGDAAFAELFHKLYCSEDWLQARAPPP
jgi:hypothetical protein